MTEPTNRLYDDLAWLWPMWGAPSEYQDYCAQVIRLVEGYADRELNTLLNVGCGGGKNVFNLKERFSVTGLDASQPMLDLAAELNPGCEFIRADMRRYSLDRKFDVVLIDDAVSYMTSEKDLSAVFERAYRHLAPGGVMFVGPDDTKETFQQNSTHTTKSIPAGEKKDVEVIFVENNYDPDPADSIYEALMVYIIRENTKLSIEQDLHILGLFSIDTWRVLLADAGFMVHEEKYIENEKTYTEFICLKPRSGKGA